MSRLHHYTLRVDWTGNKGLGTVNYRKYERSHVISAPRKVTIEGSSDPCFRGDDTKYNPEELLLASLSSCHMLWYLHLCSEAGIVVTDYYDQPDGTMQEADSGKGHFIEVVLNPMITITDASQVELAKQLHKKANEMCFIANSVNFKVSHVPTITAEGV